MSKRFTDAEEGVDMARCKKKASDYYETEDLSFENELITPAAAKKRACGFCGCERTLEDYDGCLDGVLPEYEVMNACCGHGDVDEAYVQFSNGKCIRGKDAIKFQRLKRTANREVQ